MSLKAHHQSLTHTHTYIYRFPHVLDAYERRKPSHPLNTCWLTSSSENIHFLHRKSVHEFNEVSLFRTINIQVKVFQINTDKRSVLKSVLLRALTELRQYHWVPIYIKSSSAKFYYLLPRKRLQRERERESSYVTRVQAMMSQKQLQVWLHLSKPDAENTYFVKVEMWIRAAWYWKKLRLRFFFNPAIYIAIWKNTGIVIRWSEQRFTLCCTAAILLLTCADLTCFCCTELCGTVIDGQTN